MLWGTATTFRGAVTSAAFADRSSVLFSRGIVAAPQYAANRFSCSRGCDRLSLLRHGDSFAGVHIGRRLEWCLGRTLNSRCELARGVPTSVAGPLPLRVALLIWRQSNQVLRSWTTTKTIATAMASFVDSHW